MTNKKETSKKLRERLHQEELKNNPTGSLNDSFNRANSSMSNLNGMSWKETGVLILLLIVGYLVYKLFF